MWPYFWQYQTDLPSGSGFATFSPTHLAWLAVSWLLIALAALGYRYLSPPARLRAEQSLAVLIASTYLFRWIWAAALGHLYASEMLPLHLCAVAALVDTVAAFTRPAWLKDFGYACGIPGAIIAFLLPGIGPYPVWHFYYLLFTLDHAILILLPVIWISGGRLRPNIRNLPRCLGLLLIMAGFALLANQALGSNFMFLTTIPPDTPLTPLAKSLGNPGYQFVMAALLFLIWGLLYLPWIIHRWRRRLTDEPGR